MGNRAVITTSMADDVQMSEDIGVYLHWNGGRDSVEAFLKYCKLKGYRPPENDTYGWARLCQVIGNYFGGGLSIGIDKCCHLDCDNYDNGVYIIKNWEIVDRKYFDGVEQNAYDLNEMLIEIDKAQPVKEQLGDYLNAEEIPRSELKIGDLVYVNSCYDNSPELHKVIGLGRDTYVNGHNVNGVPYVNKWSDLNGNYSTNINNYIFEETVRIKENE